MMKWFLRRVPRPFKEERTVFSTHGAGQVKYSQAKEGSLGEDHLRLCTHLNLVGDPTLLKLCRRNEDCYCFDPYHTNLPDYVTSPYSLPGAVHSS